MNVTIPTILREIRLMGFLALAAGSSGFSQPGPKTAASPVDTFDVIVPVRPIDEMQKEIDAIQISRVVGKNRLAEAKDAVRKLELQIELREKEIAGLEGRKDSADKEEKEAEVAALKTQIGRVEKLKDLLTQRKELRSAEVDAAAARIECAEATEEAIDSEIALAKKRLELKTQTGAKAAGGASSVNDPTIRELEKNVLDARAASLKKSDKSVSLDQDVLDEQRKLAEAQVRFREEK